MTCPRVQKRSGVPEALRRRPLVKPTGPPSAPTKRRSISPPHVTLEPRTSVKECSNVAEARKGPARVPTADPTIADLPWANTLSLHLDSCWPSTSSSHTFTGASSLPEQTRAKRMDGGKTSAALKCCQQSFTAEPNAKGASQRGRPPPHSDGAEVPSTLQGPDPSAPDDLLTYSRRPGANSSGMSCGDSPASSASWVHHAHTIVSAHCAWCEYSRTRTERD